MVKISQQPFSYPVVCQFEIIQIWWNALRIFSEIYFSSLSLWICKRSTWNMDIGASPIAKSFGPLWWGYSESRNFNTGGQLIRLMIPKSGTPPKNVKKIIPSLKDYTVPETNIAPENWWLEYYFPIGARPIFRCELLVSGRVNSGIFTTLNLNLVFKLAWISDYLFHRMTSIQRKQLSSLSSGDTAKNRATSRGVLDDRLPSLVRCKVGKGLMPWDFLGLKKGEIFSAEILPGWFGWLFFFVSLEVNHLQRIKFGWKWPEEMRSKHSKQSQLLMYVQDPDEIAMQRQEAWEYMGDVKHFMIMMVMICMVMTQSWWWWWWWWWWRRRRRRRPLWRSSWPLVVMMLFTARDHCLHTVQPRIPTKIPKIAPLSKGVTFSKPSFSVSSR